MALFARDEYIKRGKARYKDHLKMMNNAKKSSLEKEVEYLEKKIEEQNAAIDKFSKAFVRISKAFGINSPLALIANAENNEESLSDILVKIIESKMAEDDIDQRMKNELGALMDKLIGLGCNPVIYRRGKQWRAHVNACGSFWDDADSPVEALKLAIKKWEKK